jgi:cation diffusion facilitator family transporter
MTIARTEVLGYALLATLVNVVLMLVKIVVGMVGNSYALVADGIESASDILVSLVTWIGFGISLRPPDEGHPYGHGKIESLAGIFSGMALLIAAGAIAYQSIQEILTPHHSPEWYTLPVLLVVVAIKEILARRISVLSEISNSRALEGDAWHHRSDAITSGAAAVGISIALIGGPGYAAADDWAALIACSVICFNGSKIVVRSFNENIDGRVDAEFVADIRSHAADIREVRAIEKSRVRKSGSDFFAEIHVEVDPECTVKAGHEIAHKVKAHLMDKIPSLQDVLIHIEPHRPREANRAPGVPDTPD